MARRPGTQGSGDSVTDTVGLGRNAAPQPEDSGSRSFPEDRVARIALLAENQAFAAGLATYLTDHGMLTDRVGALGELLDSLAWKDSLRRTDVVILEARAMLGNVLPRLSRIRRVSDVPCIVLGGEADEVARIVLLEAGADDCLAMPVGPREILARLRALLRRREPDYASLPVVPPEPRATPQPSAIPRQLDLGNGWRLCRHRRDLHRPDGTRCLLTTAEFDLLDCLARSACTPVSREEICRAVYRRRHWAEDRSVDNLVVRLRRKLEPDPKRPDVIRSIRSVGYMFSGFPGPDVERGQAATYDGSASGMTVAGITLGTARG